MINIRDLGSFIQILSNQNTGTKQQISATFCGEGWNRKKTALKFYLLSSWDALENCSTIKADNEFFFLILFKIPAIF